MPKVKTGQITVPLTQLSLGVHGPFTSGLLPSDLTGYTIDFTNDASWPASGDVISILIEESNDSGQSWLVDSALTIAGGQWKTRQGANTNTFGMSVSLQNQGSTTRKLRFTANVLQVCKLGAVLSSV